MLRLNVTIDSRIFTELAEEAKQARDAADLATRLGDFAGRRPEFGPDGRDIAADPQVSFPLERMLTEEFWAGQRGLLDYLESHLDKSVRDVGPFLPPVPDDRPVPVTVHPVPGLTACYGSGEGRQIFGLMDGADPREMTLFCSHTYLHEVAGHINTAASERAEADPAAPGAMVHLMLLLIRNEGLANLAMLAQLEPLIAEGIPLPYFDYAHLLRDEKATRYALTACRRLLGQVGPNPPAQLLPKVTAAFKNPKLPIINLVGTHLAKVIAAQQGLDALVDLADTDPHEFFARYAACDDPLAAELFGQSGEFDQVVAAARTAAARAAARARPARSAAPGHDRASLIDLSLGAPIYPQVIDLATVLDDRSISGYAPMGGLPALRSAVAQRLRDQRGVGADPADVVMTAGASGGLFASLIRLTKPGQGIAIPDPGFPLYRLAASSLGLKVLTYRLVAGGDGFTPDFDELAAAAKQATVLLWNFPSNPLGTAAEPGWIDRLLAVLAESSGLTVICDDVYSDIVYDGAHVPAAAAAPPELLPRLWSLYSFSKSDGLAGWRVGYVHAPGGSAGEVARIAWGMTMSVSTASQLVALAALATPAGERAARLRRLRASRDLAVTALRQAGLPAMTPPAGLFCWPDISATGLSPDDFVARAARECGVLLSPGTDFSPAATDRVRLSFAGEPALLSDALARLGGWVADVKPARVAEPVA